MEVANAIFEVKDKVPLKNLEGGKTPPTYKKLVFEAENFLSYASYNKKEPKNQNAEKLADWLRLSKEVYNSEFKAIKNKSTVLDLSSPLLREFFERHNIDRDRSAAKRLSEARESQRLLTLLNARRMPGYKFAGADNSEAMTAASNTWDRLTKRETPEETISEKEKYAEVKKIVYGLFKVPVPSGW